MSHSPIQFRNLRLTFPQKTCFEDFTASIYSGNRIAIVGRNGSGKTALFKILQNILEPTAGAVTVPSDVSFGYVPQVIEETNNTSGGQKFMSTLSKALLKHPNVLILDEPTNHLDSSNRKSLFNMLSRYKGTLITASHDSQFLESYADIIWYIDNGQIIIYKGNYNHFLAFKDIQHKSILLELADLNAVKKESHLKLMKEQKRAKNSKLQGEKSIRQRKWPTIVSDEKAKKAVETSGRKKHEILEKKHGLQERLNALKVPEVIKPKFFLSSDIIHLNNVVNINNGSCGYEHIILHEIYMQISSNDKIAIKGTNGSGKTTLVKAILGKPEIMKLGDWYVPENQFIGYLDQNYNNLNSFETPLQALESFVPAWNHKQLRSHLNDFLFKKSEQVNAPILTLSGGERVRLSLALIAAKTPKLLILDEITNNLDMEIKAHVTQILKSYPSAMIVNSHDEEFLKAIDLTNIYDINNTKLIQ